MRAAVAISRGAIVGGRGRVDAALEGLRAAGWRLEPPVVATSRAAVAEVARRARDEGLEAVVAVGGDGTIAAAAGELRDAPTVLVPLPAGTANGWAREMGIPRDARRAATFLPGGRVDRVDLGTVVGATGEHPFLATAGVGYDAAVVAGTPRALKRWLRVGAYALAATRTWPAYRGAVVRVRVDGFDLETPALLVSIGNTRRYGGLLTMLPRAECADGLLDACVFAGVSWRARSLHLARVLTGRHVGARDVHYVRAPALDISSAPPLPVQADGDYVGETPIEVRCHHLAIRVLLPDRAPLESNA